MTTKLLSSQLSKTIDPASLGIQTTQEVAPLEGVIGQVRAVSALQFGLGMYDTGFNLYIAGPPGIGKMSAVRSFLEGQAKHRAVPADLCYVNNFDDSYQPLALQLPSGRGRALQMEMKSLLEHVRRELPAAFESEEYSARRDQLVNQLNFQRNEIFSRLNSKAQETGFTLQASPYGIMTVPLKEGQPISEEQFEALDPQTRKVWQERHEALQPDVRQAMKAARDLERNARDKLQTLDQQVAQFVVGGMIEDLCEKFAELPAVISYLGRVQKDILENIDLFRPNPTPQANQSPEATMAAPWLRELPFRRYMVNVVVDNSTQQGAPVIVELNPSHNNLFGRIEKESQFGALYTDFTMIKAGSYHQANGGYLVLQIEDILRELYSWDTLKRSIRSGHLQIEEMADRLGFVTTKSLRPQPLPMQVKVVLVGRPLLYQLLLNADPDFAELFKVRVDFDTRMPLTDENIHNVTAFFSMICHREHYRALDATAVAHLLEHAMRMAEDQSKLSAHLGHLADVVREANYWAEQERASLITRQHVQKALEQRIYRASQLQERLQEMVARNMLLIDTSNSVVGQINGLSVLNLGDYMFGQPSRITASVEPGSKGVIDIEREVEMGGPIHSKGVMILSGYLAQHYGQDRPLTLSARLVFEQNYEGVEGDSASSTELYALLSAIAQVPLRQGIAVTGSVNQRGQVQVIGGVNEKIEGFFDICKARGLTGEQGVLIPAGNLQNLMLRADVCHTVEEGQFHIWAIQTIDEGIELLTGIPAGVRDQQGEFPTDSIHGRVMARLNRFESRLKEMMNKNS